MSDYPPLEREILRFRHMSIDEIEKEFRSEVSRLSWLFEALSGAGRINGGIALYNRAEEELVKILRESWVK